MNRCKWCKQPMVSVWKSDLCLSCQESGPPNDECLESGDSIPGTNLYRAFCEACGDAMRTDRKPRNGEWSDDFVCSRCRIRTKGVSSPTSRLKDDHSEGDHGYGSYYSHGMTAEDQNG